MARTSSARSVVSDEPGRADILLGSTLLCESDQKDEQEVPVLCFHNVHVTLQSNTRASNVQRAICNTVTILKCTALDVPFMSFMAWCFELGIHGSVILFKTGLVVLVKSQFTITNAFTTIL